MRALVAALVVASSACRLTGPTSALRPLPRDSTTFWQTCDPSAECRGEVRFTYLGVAGLLIEAGGDALLTAPSFTHPRFMAIAMPMVPIHSDTALVDRELHHMLGRAYAALDDVQAILVGHSHYDHLMDVPVVARRYAPHARIYGTLTTKRTLMGDEYLSQHRERIDSLYPPDSAIATTWRVGRWNYTPNRHLRFMAVRSSHAPNWWFITMAPCRESHDRRSLPRTAWGWCVGEPVSYVIDILDEMGKPLFRAFYQDAASQPVDVVLPPFLGDDAHPIDVAIVCAGNFKKVESYPTVLLAALRPKYVIVAHWEDFFHSPDDVATPVRLTDTKELAARLDLIGAKRWRALTPGARVVVGY